MSKHGEDMSFREMWESASQRFETTTNQNFDLNSKVSLDDCLKKIENAQSPVEDRDRRDAPSRRDKWKRHGLSTLRCLRLLGGVVAEGAGMVFQPSNVCFSALSMLLDVPQKVHDFWENVDNLLDTLWPSLSDFQIYQDIKQFDHVERQLKEIVHKLMICFVDICALCVSLQQSSKMAEAGQRILKLGGNAAATVAVAAALNMTEPASTGIGGDMFCLFFDATNKDVHALDGSGRSAMNTSVEQIREQLGVGIEDVGKLPFESALSVTVPGAAAGWVDAVEGFGSGKVGLEEVLMPAIELGEEGFPVSEISAQFWGAGEQQLRQASPNFREMLKRDESPEHHERKVSIPVELPKPSSMLFNCGAVTCIYRIWGATYVWGTETTTPISFKFQGQKMARMSNAAKVSGDSENDFVELWEHPPNGQGIVALMALGILEELEVMREVPSFTADDHNSISYLHAVIESLKIAFADGHWWVTDPDHSTVKPDEMVSRPYLSSRAKLFKQNIAQDHSHGQPGVSPAHNHSDTVYFCVTDRFGNGMSFINSNYEGFGSGIIPEGCGFTLQNRGANFQIGPAGHPNIYEPGKRPYHTIIPGMITQNDLNSKCQLHSVFGVMGGFMQPQGHLQVLLNMEVF
ncbi:gamma-glutamyltranspeptidase [Colletotrichum asianum]|uniref:Gamma-glutamyltranspeptidase n=1 Tax=Colletotrichum asianum TaxID=702518 RepID=A0A8H3VY21_9PEZI|nr:gamma-glutamyltranspeptidase [Colletotrichum asianum]